MAFIPHPPFVQVSRLSRSQQQPVNTQTRMTQPRGNSKEQMNNNIGVFHMYVSMVNVVWIKETTLERAAF